ncbi:MAG: lipoprotein [Gammaproteobacteria bacterium]|nr:lipoprotein [Gammaproteobacteria bacterium]
MKKLILAALAAATLAGCATTPSPFTNAKDEYEAMNDFYMGFYENRTYIFDDAKVWSEFVQFGEPTFRNSMIGQAAKGGTLVVGLTKAQAKALEKGTKPYMASLEVYNGKLSLAEDMYAEVFDGNKYMVFTDMKNLRNYLVNVQVSGYTDSGAGPNGRDVVYAGQSAKPAALVEKFKKAHSKSEKVSAKH